MRTEAISLTNRVFLSYIKEKKIPERGCCKSAAASFEHKKSLQSVLFIV